VEGVVSLLDERHTALAEALWAELERACGLHGVAATPFPHFSYQVAERYDRTALGAALNGFASEQPPFVVTTTGLGLFTGPRPVVYLPVVRTAALSRFHQALWQAIAGAGFAVQAYYHPDSWVPHITIGFDDVGAEGAAAIVRRLAERPLNWEIAVESIAFIGETEGRQEIVSRHPLGGPAAEPNA